MKVSNRAHKMKIKCQNGICERFYGIINKNFTSVKMFEVVGVEYTLNHIIPFDVACEQWVSGDCHALLNKI